MPEELKIGGHIWKVVLKELDNKLGETDWDKQTIFIHNEISIDQQYSSLLHEILHCCNSTLDSTDLGHALLDSLSEQLYQVFKDNKLVIQ